MKTARVLALHHAEDFAAAQKGNTFAWNNNLRMGPDGVFVADQKIADLAQVVETNTQGDIREISRRGRTAGSLVGAVAGATGGLLLGRFLAQHFAHKQCGGGCGDERALMLISLIGVPVTGGLLGYLAAGRKTENVIYRMP